MKAKKHFGSIHFKATALYGATSVASYGAIVNVSNVLNFTSDGGAAQTWDVDQDGTGDVTMNAKYSTSKGGIASDLIVFDLINDANFGEFVQKATGGIIKLPDGFTVGATLAADYAFGGNNNTIGRVQFNNFDQFKGFTEDVAGKIGFSFKIGGQLHYGWASLTVDVTGPNSITISEWAYNDTAGTSIQVGAVPEPAETAAALGLLAAGAAGVRRWRRMRQSAV